MINENYARLLKRVEWAAARAGRDPASVKVVAVTKTVSSTEIKVAMDLGIRDFGENRFQEARDKIQSLPASIYWHFIGHLQTNKASDVQAHFSLIHSLDRLKLARELSRCAGNAGKNVAALVQVNISGEKSKSGLDPRELKDFLTEIRGLSGLEIKGLMTIAPLVDKPEEARVYFRQLNRLRAQTSVPGIDLQYLSMGMSNDFEVAIEEGAHIIRVGTALFGPGN